MVKSTYQLVRKARFSVVVILTPLESMALIVPPSVLKKRVAMGLYSFSWHLALWYDMKLASVFGMQWSSLIEIKKKVVEVIIAKNATSNTLCQLRLTNRLRIIMSLVLILTKRAPSRPQKRPIRRAPGSSYAGIF